MIHVKAKVDFIEKLHKTNRVKGWDIDRSNVLMWSLKFKG